MCNNLRLLAITATLSAVRCGCFLMSCTVACTVTVAIGLYWPAVGLYRPAVGLHRTIAVGWRPILRILPSSAQCFSDQNSWKSKLFKVVSTLYQNNIFCICSAPIRPTWHVKKSLLCYFFKTMVVKQCRSHNSTNIASFYISANHFYTQGADPLPPPYTKRWQVKFIWMRKLPPSSPLG